MSLATEIDDAISDGHISFDEGVFLHSLVDLHPRYVRNSLWGRIAQVNLSAARNSARNALVWSQRVRTGFHEENGIVFSVYEVPYRGTADLLRMQEAIDRRLKTISPEAQVSDVELIASAQNDRVVSVTIRTSV